MIMLHSDKKAINEIMQIIGNHGNYHISRKTNKRAIEIMAIGERSELHDFLFIIKLYPNFGSPFFSVEKIRRSYQHAQDYKPQLKIVLREKRFLKKAGVDYAHQLLTERYFLINEPSHNDFLFNKAA